MCPVQIPVRMGSNRFFISLSAEQQQQQLGRIKLVELALRRLNPHAQAYFPQTYAIFESICGIERLVGRGEDLAFLCRRHASQHTRVEFVIRKCGLVEQSRVAPTDPTDNKNSKLLKKCYKKLNQLKATAAAADSSSSIAHIYEHIDEASRLKSKYVEKIAQNEIKLKRQTKKLQQVEKQISTIMPASTPSSPPPPKMCLFQKNKLENDMSELKLAQNINFLKYLYSKLRNQNGIVGKSFYSKFLSSANDSQTQLLLSNDFNSCGNSADEETWSASSSRSNSSSALESLV